jgi:hypothetical protein
LTRLLFVLLQSGQGPELGRPHSKKKRRAKNACVVVFSEKDYEDRHEEEQPLECELRGQDLNGTHYNMIKIKGLKASWARKNKVKSGVTTFFAENSTIDEELNELVIATGQAIEVNCIRFTGSCVSKIVCHANNLNSFHTAWKYSRR